ncbi:MAG: AMP-binding protein [Planctomycetota bacterium]
MSDDTLVALFARLRDRLEDEVFLRAPGEERTTGQSVRFAEHLAAALRASGVLSGDRVVVHLPHGPAQAMAVFAVALCGGVVVLANSRSKAVQLRDLVDDCDPRVAISHQSFRSVFDAEAAFGGTSLLRLDWNASGELSLEGEAVSDPGPRNPVDVSADDLAILLYTSGSTGKPKGVMQSHRSLVDGARIVGGYLGLTRDDHLYGLLPLSFDYGLNQLLSAVWVGASLTLRPFLSGKDLHQALVDSGATVCAGVPEVHLALVDAAAELGAGDLALRIVTNSGGAFPQRALEAYERQMPSVSVFSMYGLTEAFRSSFVLPAELQALRRTVGRAMPEVELLVVDEQTGQPLPVDESGELVHCGACVAQGYWRRPEETAARFRPDPRGGDSVCVFSGDLATIDESGVVTLHGRRDAQLKIHGQRVSPDEVTAVVRSVDGIASAAAVGVPRGEDRQTVLAVALTLESGGEATGLDRAVRSACRRALPPHMVPGEIHVLDELPLTSNHKVDHVRLRAELEQRDPPPQRGR